MSTNEKKLQEILEKLIDGEKGFKQAANNIKRPVLKNFFHNKALEKAGFINELKLALQAKGIDIDVEGSNTASVHRAWMDIKIMLSSDTKDAMLSEASTGEKAAVKDYKDVLDNQHLDLQVRTLLERQKKTIKNGIFKIEELEDFME